MKLIKNRISRDEALKISPDYVAYAEGDFDAWKPVNAAFEKIKRGQKAITFHDRQFYNVKVTSVNATCLEAMLGDGPVVRVSNGEYSWRVDGDKLAFPKS